MGLCSAFAPHTPSRPHSSPSHCSLKTTTHHSAEPPSFSALGSVGLPTLLLLGQSWITEDNVRTHLTGGTRLSHHVLLADCICLPRAASALGAPGGPLLKGRSCSRGGAVWKWLCPPERCSLLCYWTICFQTFSCAFIHTCKEAGVQISCPFALPLLCLCTCGKLCSGGRLEDRKQEEAFVCFLWHLLHSLGTHVAGLPGSPLEYDPDSEGLSVPSSLLVPLAEGWWQLPAAADH